MSPLLRIGTGVWLLGVSSFLALAETDSAAELPWSFIAPVSEGLDQDLYANWAFDDVDRFIAMRLEESDLRPNPPADRNTLIRRAALDLTGLPPSISEIERFLADPRSDSEAFASVVDDYLASPRFGERWGRHWLDVARYADSVGRTWNAPFVYAWKYRDWVIDSFNQDKSYRRFIAEQIAGDLLPADSVQQRRDQIIGTGFLTLGSLSINQGTGEAFVLDQIDDQIDVTTRGFLALSIACARCHDHKYDPVAQMDYYALAGVFYSSWTYPGQAHVSDHTSSGYVDPEMLVRLPNSLDAPLDRVRSLPNGIHTMGDLRQFGGKAPPPFDLEPDWAMGMRDGKPVDCALREGGMAWDRGAVPPRGDLRIPGLPEFPTIPEDSSGRLQLAQWIASPENPLTARVAVNRVWLHLFGKGLVESVDNFGATGTAPSHPELLDHLAVDFMADDWSMKRLIRRLMLSRAYQMSSEAQAKGMAEDPDNTLYWRVSPRRLQLEPLRDSLLQVSDRLETEPPAPGVMAGNGGKGRSKVRGEIGFHSPYRTIYLPVIRDLLPETYGIFDFPDPSSVSGQRHITTAPPQALFFLNSSFVEDCADDLAQWVLANSAGVEEGVELSYLRSLARKPTIDETREAIDFLDSLQEGEEAQRWATFLQALLGSAEFRYVF